MRFNTFAILIILLNSNDRTIRFANARNDNVNAIAQRLRLTDRDKCPQLAIISTQVDVVSGHAFFRAMQYCERGVKIWDVWIDRGISHCFLDTVSSSFLAAFLTLFGLIELVQYARHGSRSNEQLRRRQCQFGLHVTVQLLLAVVFPVAWLLAYYQWSREELFGHHVVRGVVQFALWLLAVLLTVTERHWDLPTPPTRGHGLALIIFWGLSVIDRCLAIASFNGRWWWWHIHR